MTAATAHNPSRYAHRWRGALRLVQPVGKYGYGGGFGCQGRSVPA